MRRSDRSSGGPVSNEGRPHCVVLGRGDVGTIVKRLLAPRGQVLRHEAQLDERPHADREQKIHDPVGVEEGVQPCSTLAGKRVHWVRQQPVEANVLQAELTVRFLQLRLPVRAERERGMPAPDRVFPGMRKRRLVPGLATRKRDHEYPLTDSCGARGHRRVHRRVPRHPARGYCGGRPPTIPG